MKTKLPEHEKTAVSRAGGGEFSLDAHLHAELDHAIGRDAEEFDGPR
jgi:hypothetical protein